MKDNIEYFFIESQKKIKIGDVININGTNTPVTRRLITLNPDMFRVVNNTKKEDKTHLGGSSINFSSSLAFATTPNGLFKKLNISNWDLTNITDLSDIGKKTIFTTFDGVQIYDEDQILYGVPINHPILNIGDVDLYINKPVNFAKDNNIFWNWFSSKYDRQRWIIENSKYIKYVGHLVDNTILFSGRCFYKDNISDYLEFSNNYWDFKPIKEEEYVGYLIKEFKKKYPDNVLGSFSFDSDNLNLYFKYKNNISIKIYDVLNDKWYLDAHINQYDEIIHPDDDCYFFLIDNTNKYIKDIISKDKFKNILISIENKNKQYNKKHSIGDFFVSKSKKTTHDHWYKIQRRKYTDKLDVEYFGFANKKEKALHLLNVIAKDLNNGWSFDYSNPNCNGSVIVYDGHQNKFLVMSCVEDPSVTDVVFKNRVDAETTIKIMGDYLYNLVNKNLI
jgi:hypothetical protein